MFTNMNYLVLFSQNKQDRNCYSEEDSYSEKSYDPSEKSFDPGDLSEEEEELDPDNWEEDLIKPLEKISVNS